MNKKLKKKRKENDDLRISDCTSKRALEDLQRWNYTILWSEIGVISAKVSSILNLALNIIATSSIQV